MHHLFHNEGGWVNPETRDYSARSICPLGGWGVGGRTAVLPTRGKQSKGK